MLIILNHLACLLSGVVDGVEDGGGQIRHSLLDGLLLGIFLAWVTRNRLNFLLGLFHRRLEVLLDHFDFLLNQINFRLDRFSKIISRFLEPSDGLADLSPDLWKLLGAKQ
jgi:hypothetical protein